MLSVQFIVQVNTEVLDVILMPISSMFTGDGGRVSAPVEIHHELFSLSCIDMELVSQLRPSIAFQNTYAELLFLPDAGARHMNSAQNRLCGTGNRAQYTK